jgi:hypothetical protein
MTNKILPDMSDENQKRLAFLYLAKEEFGEAIKFAGALLKKKWFVDGGEHSSYEARALDIAIVITYSRPFKKNYGFGTVDLIMNRAMNKFTRSQRELHEIIINARDREYAHADAEANDIEVYFDDMFAFSKRVTREPIQQFEIKLLIEMCRILITSINEQINEVRITLTNQL